MKKEVTEKQKRFCQEYIIDNNGTQAVIRAGYSKSSAKVRAYELLHSPEVKAYLQTLQEAMANRLQISSDMVVKELANLGFANIRDFLDNDKKMRDFGTIPNEKFVAIESINITETEWEGGHKTSTRIKLHSKINALCKLGQHLGTFDKDKVQNEKETTKVLVPGDNI